jgi:cell division protein FtsI/penicillin-binding protein 2
VHSSKYSELADKQYVSSALNTFKRGTIFLEDRDGQLVSGAIQTSGFKISINPTLIIDKRSTYQKLNTVIPIPENDFLAKASKLGDTYEEIADHISVNQASKISVLKLKGVSISKENWRFYPGQNIASHVLGLLGYKGNSFAGRYGLERQYNDVLAEDKDNSSVNSFAEVFSNINKTLFKSDIKTGDIVTTIEPTVQSFLEKQLSDIKAKYNPDSLGGIIMNPEDGSIYAMSVKPDFDPNDFSQIKNVSIFSNPIVENVFEFGSVVKPLVMAAALDAGVVTPATTYNDKGEVTIEKHKIFNFDKRGRGPGTTMQDVLNQSLNTGMVFVEEKLGRIPLRNYMLSYGINQKTGIDLPNETSGLVSNILTSPREIEYANAAFGQGVAFTPIEMIRALASLSNGGNLVVPHVAQKINYDDGTEKILTYPTTRVKISQATAEEITGMLVKVGDQGLHQGIPNYSVAMKTGTAQVADNATGGYYKDKHTHSFMGYFPAYNPKFIVFLYAVDPKGVAYSATTWTSPFLNITKFLLNYYEIPPDR